jgi:hypothetical protein
MWNLQLEHVTVWMMLKDPQSLSVTTLLCWAIIQASLYTILSTWNKHVEMSKKIVWKIIAMSSSIIITDYANFDRIQSARSICINYTTFLLMLCDFLHLIKSNTTYFSNFNRYRLYVWSMGIRYTNVNYFYVCLITATFCKYK